MDTCNCVNLPILTGLKLSREVDGRVIESTQCMSLVERPRYLIVTGLDIVSAEGH